MMPRRHAPAGGPQDYRRVDRDRKPAEPADRCKRVVRHGWALRQGSKAYVLALTANPPHRGGGSGGQTGRGTRKEAISYVPQPSPQEVRAAVEALARRRAVVQQRLLMKAVVARPCAPVT